MVVLALYGASAFVVPTLAPVAQSDDFLYARSVEILVEDGRLEILPATTVTLLFQVAWGGLFSAVFGFSYGVVRAATVLFTAIGAAALYALLLELGVRRQRSALGVAVYLFNPLAYVLSFTFMSDSYFVGLSVIATWLYVRGVRTDRLRPGWLVAGSAAATCAFLTRQQGIVLPLAVLTYLALAGRLRPARAALVLGAQVAALPALAVAGYVGWLAFIRELPPDDYHSNYFDAWSNAGADDLLELVARVVFVTGLSIGLFVLPLAAAAAPSAATWVRRLRPWQWGASAAVLLVVGVASLGADLPQRLPVVAGWLNRSGLGPRWDLRGGRLPLVRTSAWTVLTILTLVALAAFTLLLVRRLPGRRRPLVRSAPIALVGSVLVWQVVGTMGPSLSAPFDRYFLCLLPFAIGAFLWATRDVRLGLPLAVVATVAMGAFAVAGTHDYLEYQSASWRAARGALADGVPADRLDAGAAWDGAQLYETALRERVTRADALRSLAADLPDDLPRGPLLLSPNDVEPWWHLFFAPGLEGGYVVSAEPLAGFDVVRSSAYSTWLEPEETRMYLLRIPDTDAPGPT